MDIQDSYQGRDGSSKPLKNLSFRLMPTGDSITTGSEPVENSYRELLLSHLNPTTHPADYNRITMVGPITKWGSMKPSELNRTDAWMGRKIHETHKFLKESLPEWKPDVILLHTGTNDMAPLETHDPQEHLVEEVDAIMGTIHELAPKCVTLVALIIPAAFRVPQIGRFNGSVMVKIEKRRNRGEKFAAADMFTAWPDDTFRDLAHPNALGYEEMARRWRDALEKINGWGWLDKYYAS